MEYKLDFAKKTDDGGLITPIGVFPTEQTACPNHGGRKVVREVPVKNLTKGGTDEVRYEFSDNVGPQKDCLDCQDQLGLIEEHVEAVLTHDRMSRRLTKKLFGIPFSIREGEEQEKLRNALAEAAQKAGFEL
jgi:hypothetical protein